MTKNFRFSHEPVLLLCEWEECEDILNGIENLLSHISVEHLPHLNDYDLHCHWKECEGFTESLEELRRHILFHAFHTKIKCFGANLQDRKNMTQCTVSSQGRNIVPEIPEHLVCGWNSCFFVYECTESFYRHVESHSLSLKSGPVTCLWQDCSRVVHDCHKLKEHLRTHTQEKLIACPTCGGMFSTRTKFIDHIQRQMQIDEKDSYVCEYCPKKFNSERLLRDHMKVHVNHYKCMYCDMTCPSPSALRSHVKYRHSEEKPHSCQHCDYQCKSETDLRKHLESHQLTASFTCSVENCKYSSRSSTCYKNHFRQVHEAKAALKYACHLCDKTFTRGNYLTKHLQNHHKFCWPSGHCRFRYTLKEDGCYRLQTVRYESAELTEEMSCESPKNTNVPAEDDDDTEMNDPVTVSRSPPINEDSELTQDALIAPTVICAPQSNDYICDENELDTYSSDAQQPILIKILDFGEESSSNANGDPFLSVNIDSTNVDQLTVIQSISDGRIVLDTARIVSGSENRSEVIS